MRLEAFLLEEPTGLGWGAVWKRLMLPPPTTTVTSPNIFLIGGVGKL